MLSPSFSQKQPDRNAVHARAVRHCCARAPWRHPHTPGTRPGSKRHTKHQHAEKAVPERQRRSVQSIRTRAWGIGSGQCASSVRPETDAEPLGDGRPAPRGEGWDWVTARSRSAVIWTLLVVQLRTWTDSTSDLNEIQNSLGRPRKSQTYKLSKKV